MNYVTIEQLQVAKTLYNFINNEAISNSKIAKDSFWKNFSKLVHDLSPKNSLLLKKRLNLQEKIDKWHITNRDADIALEPYKEFLSDIGYLVPEGPDFNIGTKNVDNEIATIAGPQLVVPVSNARYALNAANARWGSLYDALYGTDAIASTNDLNQNDGFDFSRGKKVISWGRNFLDETIPLETGTHAKAIKYSIKNGQLLISQADKSQSQLANPEQFRGYNGNPENPSSVILCNNGLHIQIEINSGHFIGKTDLAGISDIILESALTTIVDFEDSIAAVDAEDKVDCYRNWLGLMLGTLNTPVKKYGQEIKRQLNCDKSFIGANGNILNLPGRSLMLVRNVGHLMSTNSILDSDNKEIPEGILDAVVTSLIATIDLNRSGLHINSQVGSIYIVKPKMHGPEEVAFADELFSRVEELLHLEANTIKMGIMDEERRTTINLKECIRSASNRVAFINTGFLDRTGDEIFTSMEAGPVVQKATIKEKLWLQAYENWNVDNGLRCGLQGRAQIGKGMWAMPDMMSEMIKTKINHPQEGANTAWVPSPTAATLHSIHYHKVDVFFRQNELKNRKRANLDDILTIPLAQNSNWTIDEVQNELENNAQGILGYVVRWINQGIGCSKVPDIKNIGLMEDRATLRISSQHIANWLHHNICSKDQVIETMEKMARVVDQQNENDPEYVRMSDDFESSIAFQAACDLVLKGRNQPSGYTEPILHARRLELKQKHNEIF